MIPRRSLLVLRASLAACLVVGGWVAVPAAAHTPRPGGAPDGDRAPAELSLEQVTAAPAGFAASGEPRVEVFDDGQGPGLYLVGLAGEPVSTYGGGLAGLPATHPQALGGQRLDHGSGAPQAYADHLEGVQDAFVSELRRRFGGGIEVAHSYQWANNGVAVSLTPAQAQQVAGMDGVTAVMKDVERELHTDAGPRWVGATTVWGGVDDPRDAPDGGGMGEGIVVGIIDTGINPSNPSFAGAWTDDDGATVYQFTHPRGGRMYGACDPDSRHHDPDVAGQCNDKLIGLYGFDSAGRARSVLDTDGHGSHVASTAAGNPVRAEVVGREDPPLVTERLISGVAPKAAIISYAACTPVCHLSALAAAIDQAVADGVDVINYSIGSPAPTPGMWSDFDTRGFLNARAAGIFVATSAGNSGPGASTVGSPADAPWLTTVGASTHDRAVTQTLAVTVGGESRTWLGRGYSNGTGPAGVVWAGDYPNGRAPSERCLAPFAPGTFDGEIVICERGVVPRVDKGANVKAGGAGGMVLVNTPSDGEQPAGDAHVLPATALGAGEGAQLVDFVSTGDATGSISPAQFTHDPAFGDVMAGFSSRGPNRAMDTLTPDVTAPGADILAASGTGDAVEWAFSSGTSMSSPHVAGTAALVAEAQPGWTPAEIQSALMTTASPDLLSHDGVTPATPFAAGSGHVDAPAAIAAGFVMPVGVEEYEAANPALGGDPRELNLPSFAHSACVQQCSWQRTLTGTGTAPVTWTAVDRGEGGLELSVSPATFTLAPGEQATLTVTATLPEGATGWQFGAVGLEPDDPGVPPARLPAAAYPASGRMPDEQRLRTRRDAGRAVLEGFVVGAVGDARAEVRGLGTGQAFTGSIAQDPSGTDPFDDVERDFRWVVVDVADGAGALFAELVSTRAADLDVYVGRGTEPSADWACRPYRAGNAGERCVIADPEPGPWWIGVHAWRASAPGATDPFELVWALAGVPAGNASATTDGPVRASEPFAVEIAFDGDWTPGAVHYGAVSVLDGDEVVGSVPFTLVRDPDDVRLTAGDDQVRAGDTVEYRIDVVATPEGPPRAYSVTAVIPDGLTLVDGSVEASRGEATLAGRTLTWDLTQRRPDTAYDMVTRAQDPNCAMPLANRGGYLDMRQHGIDPVPLEPGEIYDVFTAGAPIHLWGEAHSGLQLLTSGLVATPGSLPSAADPRVPQELPDSSHPNGVLAALWEASLETVYDAGTGAGVSLAQLSGAGSGNGPASGVVIDFRDSQSSGAGGTGASFDFQVFALRTPRSGTHPWDVVFAYDNLGDTSDLGPVTIGLENAAGTDAETFVNHAPLAGELSDGFAICFTQAERAGTGGPATLTYRATVDGGAAGVITSEAVHVVDLAGARPEVSTAAVTVLPEPAGSVALALDGGAVGPGDSLQGAVTATVFDPHGFLSSGRVRLAADGGLAVTPEDVTFTAGDLDGDGALSVPVQVTVAPGTAPRAYEVGATLLDTSSGEKVLGTASAWVSVEAPRLPGDPPPLPGDPPPLPGHPDPGTPLPTGTVRLAGAERIATAVEISRHSFSPGVPAAYVATAGEFADALAAGPAGGVLGAPILLVGPRLPDVVAQELARLDPEEVVVLGGQAAVGTAVEEALVAAFGRDRVSRLAGANRFDTAARIAAAAFPGDAAGTVLLATGAHFADALSAGAAGARLGAPLLLTARATLPAETAAALERMQPERVLVLGGTAAVDDAVVGEVLRVAGGARVTRVGGVDRFDTNRRLLTAVFEPDEVRSVFVATGGAFADALSGAPAAAAEGAPVLLSLHGRLPDGHAALLEGMPVVRAVLLGGQAALSDAVRSELGALLPD